MDVASAGEDLAVEVTDRELGDRALVGDDRSVAVALQDDGHSGGHVTIDSHSADVDPVARQLVHAEPSVGVIADEAAERNPQAETRRRACRDRRRPAQAEVGPVDQRFALTEPDLQVRRRQDEVGVEVPDDGDVDVAHRTTNSGRKARSAVIVSSNSPQSCNQSWNGVPGLNWRRDGSFRRRVGRGWRCRACGRPARGWFRRSSG